MTQRFLAFIFLLGLVLPGFGQGDVASLKKQIAETDNDTVKALAYNRITYSYYTIDVDSSIYFAQKAFEYSSNIGHDVYTAAALKSLGRGYVMKNQYAEGIAYLQQALEIDERRGDRVASANLQR